MKTLPYMILLLLSAMIVGCQAGESAELLTYDSISAATAEVRKGVTAYDESTAIAVQQNMDAMLAKLGDVVEQAVLENDMTAEQAADVRQRVSASLKGHIQNYIESERRRHELREAILDNLAFIDETCEQARQYVLYRSNVSTQFRQYLQATRRSQIPAIQQTGD